MRAVSEVIAIILILMITISLAGLAYMFMSTTMADVTSSASSTVDTTTSSMLTSFRIESVDIAKVYVRNTGQNALSELTVYVNDEPATYNVTPTSIATGSIGTITIYSFIPDGGTIKITSPNGFSTSKVARPCAKAVGCWKFDEGSGSNVYDSSPNGNSGNFINTPSWTSGKYGNALSFAGDGDYISIPNSASLRITGEITVTAWIWRDSTATGQWDFYYQGGSTLFRMKHDPYYHPEIWLQVPSGFQRTYMGGNSIPTNSWHFVSFTYNGTLTSAYVDGVKIGQDSTYTGNLQPSTEAISIGNTAKGKIDEVRIYNRAIY